VNHPIQAPGFACAHVECWEDERGKSDLSRDWRFEEDYLESRWPAPWSFPTSHHPISRTSKSRRLRSRWDEGHANVLRAVTQQSPRVLATRRPVVRKEVSPERAPYQLRTIVDAPRHGPWVHRISKSFKLLGCPGRPPHPEESVRSAQR